MLHERKDPTLGTIQHGWTAQLQHTNRRRAHLKSDLGELAQVGGPPVVAFRTESSSGPDPLSTCGITQQAYNTPDECLLAIGDENVLARNRSYALERLRCRYDGLAHCHRLQDLVLNPPSDPERHDTDARSGQIVPNIVDKAGHRDPLQARELFHLRSRPAAYDVQMRVGHRLLDMRQDAIDEPRDALDIRPIIHHT